MIQLNVGAHHAIGAEDGACSLVGSVSVELARSVIITHASQGLAQVPRIIIAEEDRRVPPQLTEARNVTGNNGATRKCSLQWRKSKRLILRSGRVDGRRCKHLRKLALSLLWLQLDVCGNFFHHKRLVAGLWM